MSSARKCYVDPLALRQEMEPHEKKAFDLGETYKDICCASALMSSVRKGGDGNEH